MKCPYCQETETKVIDSRTCRDGYGIRRRRLCASCERRFTTYEQIDDNPVMVVKKDSTRVSFDRERLLAGIEKACYKRPVSAEQVNELVARIEATTTLSGESEISSAQLGELVMKELHALDQVAYVRFASVYREFKDVSDFEVEIRKALQPTK